MLDTDYLRYQAERCFRLARAVNDHAVVAMLENLGHQLEEKAREVERAADAGAMDAPCAGDRPPSREC